MFSVGTWRPIEVTAAAVSTGVALVIELADPEILSALAAVVWRAEDLIGLPSWVSWLVFVGLIIVLIDTIRSNLGDSR